MSPHRVLALPPRCTPGGDARLTAVAAGLPRRERCSSAAGTGVGRGGALRESRVSIPNQHDSALGSARGTEWAR